MFAVIKSCRWCSWGYVEVQDLLLRGQFEGRRPSPYVAGGELIMIQSVGRGMMLEPHSAVLLLLTIMSLRRMGPLIQ